MERSGGRLAVSIGDLPARAEPDGDELRRALAVIDALAVRLRAARPKEQ